jgi:hypothetical protein
VRVYSETTSKLFGMPQMRRREDCGTARRVRGVAEKWTNEKRIDEKARK